MAEDEKILNTENISDTQSADVTKSTTQAAAREQASQDEIIKMLQDIKKTNDLQLKYAKKQSRRSFITALACFVMMLAVCAAVMILLPRVSEVFNDVNLIMNDMKVVTSELAGADYEGMFEGVQDLIIEGSDSLTEAMMKIDEIDIDGLNRAIRNLSDAVQPFAAFFGRGR